MAYVYTYTRLDKNEIFYVGIGSDTKYKRAKNLSLRTNYFKKIINKSEHKLDIVFDNLSWEEACLKELELIALYGRKDLKTGSLVNFTDGGEGRKGSQNRITPTYQIDLQGNIIKEWINIETISKQLKIDRHNLYAVLNGKVLTSNKFIWIYKKDYSTTLVETILSKLDNEKNRRINNPTPGKKPIAVLQYDLNNNFIAEYSSVLEASNKTLTRCSCITQCVSPKYNRTTANNFIWKRKEIYG
jgi:hypothetical protein